MTNTSLEEVAQSLGKSQWATVREVIWPSVRPAAIGAALVVALYTLSDFGAVSLVRYDTFTRGIFNAYRSSFDRTGAALLSAIVVIVTIAIVLMQRRLTPTTNASSKSARRSPMRLRTGRGPAYGLLVSAGALGVGIPLMSMTRWTIVGASSADFGQLSRAIINTFGFAFAGAAVTTIFAFAISLVVSRYVTRTGKFLDTAMWIGHALPGIVVALSFVFMANSLVPAIYQTSTLVVIAYVALFVPNAVVALTTPIQQISMGLEDVARTLGVSRLGAIFKVVIPVARPALLTSFSLIALTIIKELPATLLLRPTGIETLATRLWTQTGINAFSAAAPYALMLVVLAGIPALLLNRQVRQTFSPTTSLRSSEVKS
jgi:iron(III) transport system permease protein